MLVPQKPSKKKTKPLLKRKALQLPLEAAMSMTPEMHMGCLREGRVDACAHFLRTVATILFLVEMLAISDLYTSLMDWSGLPANLLSYINGAVVGFMILLLVLLGSVRISRRRTRHLVMVALASLLVLSFQDLYASIVEWVKPENKFRVVTANLGILVGVFLLLVCIGLYLDKNKKIRKAFNRAPVDAAAVRSVRVDRAHGGGGGGS